MRQLRLLCLILVLVLALPAAGETSDDVMQVMVTGEISSCSFFREPTLGILKDWFRNSRLSLLIGNGLSQASLTFLGDDKLVLYETDAGIGVHPGDTLYTGNKEDRQRLMGAEPAWLESLRQVAPMARAALEVLDKLPDLLAPYEQTVKENISIKNVGGAAFKVTYEMTEEEWKAVWPELVTLCENALQNESVGGAFREQALATVEKVRFEKKGTFKRFTDKSGRDMGWQLTGTIAWDGGDARKMTLFGGYRENAGLYLSLKLPALRGSNDISLVLSGAFQDDKLLFDGKYSRTQDKKTDTAQAQISLNLADGVRGHISLSARNADGRKSALDLSPKLGQEQDVLRGPVGVKWSQGLKKLDLALSVALSHGAAPAQRNFARTVDLAQLDLEGFAGERERLNGAFSGMMISMVELVPFEARSIFSHDIGRNERTEGASMPVLPTEDNMDMDYLVMEEEDPS